MNIRCFFKSTNRRTINLEKHGVGNLDTQKAFTEFMVKMYKALQENPELVIEFKIMNQNYIPGKGEANVYSNSF